MKFLFIIQGEGRGHFSQALVMQDMLRRQGDEVVACLVGKSESRILPDYFLSQMKADILPFESPNFLPAAQNKRPNLIKSVVYNLVRLPVYIANMVFIKKKIADYNPDIVLNFYELLAGLTNFILSVRVPIVCIGHQNMFLHRKYIFPKVSWLEINLLRFFTKMTALGASSRLALSFYPLSDDRKSGIAVVPPLLRKEVKQQKNETRDYIHGYMLNSGYLSEIEDWHRKHPDEKLEFFWDKKDVPDVLRISDGLNLHRINDQTFLSYMAGCKGYSTTAGFESVCEALYLQKPVMMVPVHIEQICNAYDALKVGAGAVAGYFDLDVLLDTIPDYKPNEMFRKWESHAEVLIYAELKSIYNSYSREGIKISPSFR